jgi:hypothetical protein
MRLNCTEDLTELRTIASERAKWKNMFSYNVSWLAVSTLLMDFLFNLLNVARAGLYYPSRMLLYYWTGSDRVWYIIRTSVENNYCPKTAHTCPQTGRPRTGRDLSASETWEKMFGAVPGLELKCRLLSYTQINQSGIVGSWSNQSVFILNVPQFWAISILMRPYINS